VGIPSSVGSLETGSFKGVGSLDGESVGASLANVESVGASVADDESVGASVADDESVVASVADVESVGASVLSNAQSVGAGVGTSFAPPPIIVGPGVGAEVGSKSKASDWFEKMPKASNVHNKTRMLFTVLL
jgi:hypothetical protein